MSAANLKEEAWRARNARDERVRQQAQRVRNLLAEKKHLTKQIRAQVLEGSASSLVNLLNKRVVSSVDALLLLAERAYTIGLDLCLITEDNFDDALQMAEECDRKRHESGLENWTFNTPEGTETLPCLFGVPLSVKESILMKGFASTAGSVAKYKNKQAEDGIYVDVLRKNGLIPFVRSNVPQMLMIYESSNELFGRACNPWDKTRTPGGSSGGEGGLIGSRSSLVGIGSDIGGSIRIPAEFNGVYGLKPSSHRLPNDGHMKLTPSFNGQIAIPFVVGPLGSSPEDLALMMIASTDSKSLENNPKKNAYSLVVPFDTKLYKQFSLATGLRIGYFGSLRTLETTPASRRAVEEVITVIRKLGHQPVEIHVPNEKEIIGMFFAILSAEGGMRGFKEFLEGEDLIDQYTVTRTLTRFPTRLFKCLGWLVEKIRPRLGFIMRQSAQKTAYEYFKAIFELRRLQTEWINYWKNNQLDLVVAPGFGSQPQLHGTSKIGMVSACYTFIWNVLEMAVGAMPVTVVREEEQRYDTIYSDLISGALEKSATGTMGLPVGVQIVGLPYEEQKILGLMKAIDQQTQFSQKFKFPL